MGKPKRKASGWIRYPGGKRDLADRIIEKLVARADRSPIAYVEPCVGAGAVLLRLIERFPDGAVAPVLIADANPAVRFLWVHGVDPDLAREAAALDFYELRKRLNAAVTAPMVMARERHQQRIASMFWVYNKRCMNGIVRVDGARGEFNVPIGRRDDGSFLRITEEEFEAAVELSVKLRRLKLRVYEDAVQCIAFAPVGARIYVDPPYTGGFVGYSKRGWSTDDDIRLWEACATAHRERGCRIVLSQPDTDWSRAAFTPSAQNPRPPLAGFHCEEVQVGRPGNSDGEGRGPVGELLIWSPS